MRLFLAIELDDETQERWETALDPLRQLAPELAWVPGEKRHLTLKFLGDVAEHRLEQIVEMTTGVAGTHRPFTIEMREIGAFPNFRRARVVWIGVDHEPRLELMHHDVEVAGERAGFEVEGRAFRPHITVARVREAQPDERMRALRKAARAVSLVTPAFVRGITLFESTLAPSGARYRRLHVAPLGG